MKQNLIKKSNNQFNIEELISKYSKYIYTVIKKVTYSLSNEDIEEIIEDVFVVLWNNKEKINYELPIEPYIIGITKNLIKCKFRNCYINEDIENYDNTISDSIDIQLLIEQDERNKIIEHVLENMKKEDRNIFILFYYYSKNIKEIANELNITEINVKTKLYRIRKKIKKNLIEGGYNDETKCKYKSP